MPSTALQPLILAGAHVRLEPLERGHVQALVAAASISRDTYTFTFVPDGTAAMARYVDAALAEQAEGRSLPFATFNKLSNVLVGTTRFANIEHWDWPVAMPAEREGAAADAVEIGWTWLAAPAQRTAINSEAKLLMLTHAFETWRVFRVHLKTDSRNARSRAAIEHLGARLDGVLRGHSPASDGGIRDAAWYSILQSDWPAAKSALEARLLRAPAPATLG